MRSIFFYSFLIIFIGCSQNNTDDLSLPDEPRINHAILEDSDDGCEILKREFGGECKNWSKKANGKRRKQNNRQPSNPSDFSGKDLTDTKGTTGHPSEEELSDQDSFLIPAYLRPLKMKGLTEVKRANFIKQQDVQLDYPLNYVTQKTRPIHGSWRKTRAEVEEIMNRPIWSPEQNKVIPAISHFNMVLLVNVAANKYKDSRTTAQSMRVLVRSGHSNDIRNWREVRNWPISSGKPNGNGKIKTFTGVFKFDTSRFFENYQSKEFSDAKMYETMFLYHLYQNESWTGVAVHGTYKVNRLGQRDSGGCIRLERKNSQCLYRTLRGDINDNCMGLKDSSFWGKVPSVFAKGGEMDPHFLSKGGLEVGGYKVMVAIFNDPNDQAYDSNW